MSGVNSYYIKGTASASELWTRPTDWLEIDSYVTLGGAHKFIGLYAVFSDRPNRQAISSTQAFTVSIDGVATNYAASAQANLTFSYASIDPGTTTSEGFRQVRIEVYPQVGTWTGQLNISPAYIGGVKPSSFVSNFIDIRMYAPLLTNYTMVTTTGGRLSYLKKHNWIGTILAQGRSSFAGTQLRWIGDDFSTATSMTSLLSYTPQINQFIDPSNIQNINIKATAAQSYFTSSLVRYIGNITETTGANSNISSFVSNCPALLSMGNISSPRTTTMASFAYASMSLQTIGTINTPIATTYASAFFNCYRLETIGTITTGAVLTNISNMFTGCKLLRTINITNCAGVSSAANAAGLLTECHSLTSVILTGLRFGFTVAPCQMDDAAFAALFTSLGTASGAQTIVITGNPTLTAPTLAIATGKGFTVTP